MKKEEIIKGINEHFTKLYYDEAYTSCEYGAVYLRLYDETVAEHEEETKHLEKAVDVYSEVAFILSIMKEKGRAFNLPGLTEIKTYSDRATKLYNSLKNILYVGCYQIEDKLMIINTKSAEKLSKMDSKKYLKVRDSISKELNEELAHKV